MAAGGREGLGEGWGRWAHFQLGDDTFRGHMSGRFARNTFAVFKGQFLGWRRGRGPAVACRPARGRRCRRPDLTVRFPNSGPEPRRGRRTVRGGTVPRGRPAGPASPKRRQMLRNGTPFPGSRKEVAFPSPSVSGPSRHLDSGVAGPWSDRDRPSTQTRCHVTG